MAFWNVPWERGQLLLWLSSYNFGSVSQEQPFLYPNQYCTLGNDLQSLERGSCRQERVCTPGHMYLCFLIIPFKVDSFPQMILSLWKANYDLKYHSFIPSWWGDHNYYFHFTKEETGTIERASSKSVSVFIHHVLKWNEVLAFEKHT